MMHYLAGRSSTMAQLKVSLSSVKSHFLCFIAISLFDLVDILFLNYIYSTKNVKEIVFEGL